MPDDLAALSRALRYRHIPVGQIYIGDGATDAGWVAQAEQWMTDYEIHGSPMPDQVIFQSWDPLPDHVLPESDPASFTGGQINAYRPAGTAERSTPSSSTMPRSRNARCTGTCSSARATDR